MLRLSASDEPWVGVPPMVVSAVLEAPHRDALVDALVDGDDPWSGALQRRLLHPASGVAATLVEPVPGRTALDLATGWGALTPTLRTLGSQVVRADWVYTRLRLAHLFHSAPAALAVHVGLGAELPWPTSHFDLAFLDVGELDRSCARRRDGAQLRAQVLAELRRVLKDDGVAVVGTHNSLRGRPGGRSAVWRSLRSPAGEPDLRAVGLVPVRSLVPRPDRAGWKTIVPVEDLPLHLRRTTRGGPRGRVTRALVAAGVSRWLMPDYFVVVRPTPITTPTAAPAPHRTLAEVLMATVDSPSPVLRSLSDARVAVTGPVRFAKVSLSPDQQHALATEVRNTIAARTTPFAPFVLDGARLGEVGGIPFASYPTIVEDRRSPGDAEAALYDALRPLDTGATAPLSETALWRRLTGPRGRSDAAQTGATMLREVVLDTCGEMLLPVGPTHGDLHTGNVIFPVGTGPLLVDWNRFELLNPLFLDAAYATVRTQMSTTGQPLTEALLDLVDLEIAGPLAELTFKLLGQLDSYQAASILILDRVVSYSLPRRAHKPWTMRQWCDATQALTERAAARA